jgi:hypothetical protein
MLNFSPVCAKFRISDRDEVDFTLMGAQQIGVSSQPSYGQGWIVIMIFGWACRLTVW